MTFLVALEVVGRIGVGVRRTFYGTPRLAGEPEFWVLPDGGRVRRDRLQPMPFIAWLIST